MTASTASNSTIASTNTIDAVWSMVAVARRCHGMAGPSSPQARPRRTPHAPGSGPAPLRYGPALPAAFVIAAAQPRCTARDVAANARAHAEAVRAARAGGVVFPELSLTGYELDAAPVSPDDPALRPIV